MSWRELFTSFETRVAKLEKEMGAALHGGDSKSSTKDVNPGSEPAPIVQEHHE